MSKTLGYSAAEIAAVDPKDATMIFTTTSLINSSAVLLHDNDNEDTKRLLVGLDRLVKHYGMEG
jgi:hypothetical protein